MKHHTLVRQLAFGVVAASASTMAFAANYNFIASFSDYGTGSNPQPDIFTVVNQSDAGVSINQITFDLSGASNAPVFDTVDGASPDYLYGAATGFPITGLNGPDVGFVVPSAAQQAAWEEAQSITLDFTAFESGDAFAFTTDVDDFVNYFLTGAEFAGATFTVVFTTAAGNQFTRSATFRDALSTLPGNDAVAVVSGTVVPVPGALLLMLSALGGLGASRLRRA